LNFYPPDEEPPAEDPSVAGSNTVAVHPPWTEVEGFEEFAEPGLSPEPFDFNKRARPSRFSWINKDVLRPIADQRPYNTCLSYSACYCLETRRSIENSGIARLDPEMFHRCVLGLAFSQGNNNVRRTLLRLREFGAPLAGSGFTPGARCQDFTPIMLKSKGQKQISTPERAKEVIAGYAPVIVLMSAEKRLANLNSFAIYRDANGPKTFHHAMLLVGFDDVNQCWIVQNSFGTQWGEKGFGRIGYGSASILSGPTHRCYIVA